MKQGPREVICPEESNLHDVFLEVYGVENNLVNSRLRSWRRPFMHIFPNEEAIYAETWSVCVSRYG